jgi:hypothetical protein
MHRVSWILIASVLARAPLAAQATDSAPTLPPAPAPAPAPTPTPDQQKYLEGLRTAGRGVAQLKDGIDRVGRNRADTAQLRMAGQRLGGLCGSAGSFMRQGRARMSHAAYADSARTLARRLNQQVCRPASARAGRSPRPPRPPWWLGCAATRAHCRSSGRSPCSRRLSRPRRPHRLHRYCRDSGAYWRAMDAAPMALRRRGLSRTFGLGSSNTWHRYRLSAHREDHTSRGLLL